MGVIGINFWSFDASVEDRKINGNININSVPTIENVKKKEVVMGGIKEVASIEFKFITSYSPDIGSIKITGEILYQADDVKKIVSSWKDEKLNDKIVVDVLNAILKKCLAKSILIAEDLRLPPPLTFQVVKAEEKGGKDSE